LVASFMTTQFCNQKTMILIVTAVKMSSFILV
jgi:hypothetical protein